MELTPDTSFASVDENDLTEMYDQFSNQVEQKNNRDESGTDQVEINLSDMLDEVHINQSTPKKKRVWSREGVRRGGCEGGEVVEVMCTSVRRDLQTLMRLATDLHVSSLIKT